MLYVRTTVRALEPKSADTDLYLPRSVCSRLHIPQATLTFQFGSKQVTGRVKGYGQKDIAVLRPSLVYALRIPTDVPLLLRYEASQQRLVFGPLIGILVSRYSQSSPTPFGTFTPFLNEIADACRGGVVCALRLQDVNWDTETVHGLIRQNGAWHAATLPLPQCIYNRLISRKSEKSDQVHSWVERCKERFIPFFNEQFLNKWHVHQALQNEPDAANHLPKTIRYHGHHDLKEMLAAYRSVYAKPASGSMGRGIYLIRAGSSGYQLIRPSAGGGVIQRFRSLKALHGELQKRIKGTPYILQQGLKLIGVNGNPADFRVLVQKGKRGEWAVSSMVARLGRNMVVSNIARGGTMVSASQALRICGPMLSGPVSAEALKKVSLRLARLLEKTLQGHYAEFGIDLGVDIHGRIWLLEVNSKPSKANSAVQQPSAAAGVTPPRRRPRPSVVRMLDYAAYLSGFPIPLKRKSASAKANKRKRKRR
ncbi:YheC/YheD family protein [Brevibacillus sp. SYP-B805]|uniref:YheC/YheD family endospore coat-associated protein n=1 Tax=Brevibacillus sp. SYP-B805 TaxID=1578199 RepID=UPI0013ECB579|nr:YheC/YheD family protein [Brevibacillus sp. SYP-B805]NGQ94879.1 YheC/YheD family protein [Brevibacillus sp. SYP-B805]